MRYFLIWIHSLVFKFVFLFKISVLHYYYFFPYKIDPNFQLKALTIFSSRLWPSSYSLKIGDTSQNEFNVGLSTCVLFNTLVIKFKRKFSITSKPQLFAGPMIQKRKMLKVNRVSTHSQEENQNSVYTVLYTYRVMQSLNICTK